MPLPPPPPVYDDSGNVVPPPPEVVPIEVEDDEMGVYVGAIKDLPRINLNTTPPRPSPPPQDTCGPTFTSLDCITNGCHRPTQGRPSAARD